VYAPGYYKTDHRALRIRELIRWYGLRRLPRMFLATRSKPPSVGLWMPGLWADLECSRDDLSHRFWEATSKHRKSFEGLGFVECGFGRLKRNMNLNPAYREQGKINYLGASRTCVGCLLYSRNHAPVPVERDSNLRLRNGASVTIRATKPVSRDIEQVVIWFTSVFKEAVISCTNNNYSFDPPHGEEVARVTSDDPAFIHERFLSLCSRRDEAPRVFPDDSSLRAWFDAYQIKAFENRVRRGLFVKMSDQEIAEARRRLPPEPPKGPNAA
jgi:hypothetical protein